MVSAVAKALREAYVTQALGRDVETVKIESATVWGMAQKLENVVDYGWAKGWPQEAK